MDNNSVAEYFVVTVKIKEEKGFSKAKNEPIYKTITERYLVRCGDPKLAAKIVERKMQSYGEEWKIFSVAESNIDEVIDDIQE